MNLKSLTIGELTQVLKELGQPGFRAKQIYTWLHRGVRSYEEMTNLPKSLRSPPADRGPPPSQREQRRLWEWPVPVQWRCRSEW